MIHFVPLHRSYRISRQRELQPFDQQDPRRSEPQDLPDPLRRSLGRDLDEVQPEEPDHRDDVLQPGGEALVAGARAPRLGLRGGRARRTGARGADDRIAFPEGGETSRDT